MAPIRYNPLIFTGLDLTGTGGGPGAAFWGAPVDAEVDLPASGLPGEARVVKDTNRIYIWNSTVSLWVDTGIGLEAFGGTSDEGIALTNDTIGSVLATNIQLNEATETTPGGVSIGSQVFGGDKEFVGVIYATGGVNATAGGLTANTLDTEETGPADTLNIGVTNADTINIGHPGATVNVQGDTFYQDVTNLQVTDKNITINKGGSAGSASVAGLEIEEDGSITGYAQTSADRNSWELKAPNQDGVAVISPGLAGIVLDQSTADLLPLDGSRPMTGDLDMDGGAINNAGLVNVYDTPNAAAIGTEINPASIHMFDNGDGTTSDLTNLALSINGVTQSLSITPDYLQISDAYEIHITSGDLSLTSDVGVVIINSEVDITTHKIINLGPGTDPTDAVNLSQLQAVTTDLFQVTNEPTGFPNRTDSTMSFNDASRTFTIQPVGASFDFYLRGEKFTKTTPQTTTLPNLAGNHYIYFDATGTLINTQAFSSDIITLNAIVSDVYWNPDTSLHTYFAEERHGLTMDGATHGYLHTVFGARYISGLALQNFTIGSGGSNADAQFTSDQGSIRDEDILHTITAQTQIPILYRIGQNWRKKAADAYPVIYSGSAGYTGANGRLPYNQYTGGAWQLTQIGNSSYVLVHFFATNDKENPVVGIQGIDTYNSAASARLGANAEITTLSGLPFAEFVPIGSVIFESSNSFGNAIKARVFPTDTGANYVDFRGTQLYTPAGEATTHGLLSGLSNDDHIQYLLADGTRAMTGALDMGTHKISNVVDPTSAQDASTKIYTDAKVADAIADGVTTVAPSQNAVFDALALKQNVGNYITSLSSDVVASGPGAATATIQSNAVTNSKLAQMSANTIKGNNTGSTANATDLTATDVRTLLSVLPSYSGDISRTSFTAANNQAVAANVTGLAFANASIQGFEVELTIVRNTSYAQYSLKGIQKGASWEMSQDYVGDDTGLVFSITSAGQVQYTSTNTGFTAALLFRAQTV